MKRKSSFLRTLLNLRFWWILFVVLIISVAWQAWSSMANLVVTHELMGRLNDEREVRLIFVGDTGSGNESQQKVAALMERICSTTDPAGVILLGDNFYEKGVSSTTDPLWEDRFEKIYSSECLKKLTFFAILGNHDYRGIANAQIAYTRTRAGRWTMPARFYSLKFANLLEVAAADTTIADRCGIASLCSVDWLIEKLKDSTARWKILIGHHPILSGGKYKSLSGLAHYTLPELYCNGGASVYISGHDHGLQHLHGRYPTASCEVEQFISGGGGAELYPIETLPQSTLFAKSEHGILLGRFTANEERFEFYTLGSKEPSYLWTKSQGQ